jgi:hypothetical protein
MTEKTTNADIAERLARMEEKIDTLRLFVGEKPNEGLRGDVAMLVGIKNKGWGLFVGVLIFAGAVGASIKSAVTDLLFK